MSFDPITTQDDLDDILKRRLERLRRQHAREQSDLQAKLIQAQAALLDQNGFTDLLRQIIREELSILAGENHE